MAVIYLRHEKHGTKVACSEEEAKYDEGHGWVRFDLKDNQPVEAPAGNVTSIEPRRPGRPRKAA